MSKIVIGCILLPDVKYRINEINIIICVEMRSNVIVILKNNKINQTQVNE